MDIYYRLSNRSTICESKSDYINEYGIMLAMNQFADVYYSGKLFQPERLDNGMKGPVVRDIKDCDILYTRNSPSFFDRGEGIPRFCTCYPYDHVRFRQATGVMAFSEAWKELLVSGVECELANPHGRKYKNVYVSRQVIPWNFVPLQDHPKTKEIRKKFGNSFIIGYFGRMRDICAPWEVLWAWDLIQSECPGTQMILAWGAVAPSGGFADPPKGIHIMQLKREEVPYYLSACDVTLNLYRGPGRKYKGSYWGSVKTLESMCCGVPMICHSGASREEQLGEDYPLFVDFLPDGSGYDIGIFLDHLKLLYKNREAKARIGSMLSNRSRQFREDTVGEHLKDVFGKFI